jgi:hypothetical protein
MVADMTVQLIKDLDDDLCNSIVNMLELTKWNDLKLSLNICIKKYIQYKTIYIY